MGFEKEKEIDQFNNGLSNAIREQEFDEKLLVAQSMIVHGGSFIIGLGMALLQADYENSRKIKQNWPSEYQEFLELSKKDKTEKEQLLFSVTAKKMGAWNNV